MNKILTAQEVIKYFEDNGTVHLTEPSKDRHEIARIDCTDEGYVFHENCTRNTFMLGNEDITEVYEENDRIHFVNKNGDLWTLIALIHEDVSNGIDFAPSEEELPEDDDIYRLMWKRAEAIEAYINKQLCIDKDAKIKVVCQLHAEIDLNDFMANKDGSYDNNPIILYDYSYRLHVVNGNPQKPAVWLRDIYISQFDTNEEAFATLTKRLIEKLLPADKQYMCFNWDEEYGEYDDDETDGE